MRETEKAAPDSQKHDLTLCIPMSQSVESEGKAIALFRHLDGHTPNIAEAEVLNTSWSNDAAFSCEITVQNPVVPFTGLKLFTANPSEGFDHAQVFGGRYRDQEIDQWSPHSGKFKSVEDIVNWMTDEMQAFHPFFKEFGITPLHLDNKERVMRYLTCLHKHGLMYHHDDDPWECLHGQLLTVWERLLIDYYHEQLWAWCSANDEDVHDLALRVMTK